MKVKVVREFRDRTEDFLLRKKDEILDVSAARAEKLIGLNLVEKVKEEKKQAVK